MPVRLFERFNIESIDIKQVVFEHGKKIEWQTYKILIETFPE